MCLQPRPAAGAASVENKVQPNILASSWEPGEKGGTKARLPTYYLLPARSGQISAASIYLQRPNNAN